MANLLELHNHAREFGTFLRQGLWRFLRFVENLREQQDIPLPPLAGAENAVRIMSIHKAKEHLMRGTFLAASDAAQQGIINYAVPVAEVLPKAREIALELANGPQWAIRH